MLARERKVTSELYRSSLTDNNLKVLIKFTSKSKFYLFEAELPFYFLIGGVNFSFLCGAFLLLHERKVVDKYKGSEGFKTS